MKIRRRYLIGTVIEGQIDYKIVSNPEAFDCKYEFLIDYSHPRKPDFVIELPTKENELEKLLKAFKK